MPRGIRDQNESDIMGSNTGEGVEALRDQAATVGQDIKQLASQAGEVARAQLDPVEAYIREKPLTAVVIAAGIGMFLGMLWRLRD